MVKLGEILQGGFLKRVHPRLRKALKILISVVLGCLLLAGLYLLFKDTVLPSLSQKIIDMFNYRGYRQVMEAIVMELSTKLSQIIRLDEYKRRKLAATLKSAEVKLTPETYIA